MIEFEEKNNDAERMIADLKNQVLEVKRAQNNLEQQLKKRIQESKRIEEEIMHLRKKLDKKSVHSKFENNSMTLDDILSIQRPSSDKYGLGYDKAKKPEYSSFIDQGGNKRSYAAALKSPIKSEESKKFVSPLQRTNMMPRRPMSSRYQQIFLGHCYSCNNFGHRALDCKAYGKVQDYKKNFRKPKSSH